MPVPYIDYSKQKKNGIAGTNTYDNIQAIGRLFFFSVLNVSNKTVFDWFRRLKYDLNNSFKTKCVAQRKNVKCKMVFDIIILKELSEAGELSNSRISRACNKRVATEGDLLPEDRKKIISN